jgi:hypothetical protein
VQTFPRVFIERNGTSRMVRWSSAANYFSPYCTPGLTPPVTWTKVIATVIDHGTWHSASLPDPGTTEFYKLAAEQSAIPTSRRRFDCNNDDVPLRLGIWSFFGFWGLVLGDF